jgi:hypothetical protein
MAVSAVSLRELFDVHVAVRGADRALAAQHGPHRVVEELAEAFLP